MQQSNFHNYQVLRMKDAPEIQVHLVPAQGDPARWCGRSRSASLSPCGSKRNFRRDREARAAIADGQESLEARKLPWPIRIRSRNVALQFLNGLRLTRDHPFHQVADRD